MNKFEISMRAHDIQAHCPDTPLVSIIYALEISYFNL